MIRAPLVGLCVGAAALAASFAGVGPAAPADAQAQRPTITMSGSTSVFPLATKMARAYLRFRPRSVRFRTLQGGSDVGVADVAAGRVSIGNSSRDPKPGDPGGIVFNKIARDALCVVANRRNGLRNLSQSRAQAIFSGQVRNWRDIPGSRRSGAINLYVRTAPSGTQDAFDKLFMDDKDVFSGASQKASNGLIRQSVRSDRNGIGYVSLAFKRGVKPLSYKGVRCTLRNAKSGQYGGSRNFWMVTRGKARGLRRKFIRFIRDNRTARRITASQWVPLR